MIVLFNTITRSDGSFVCDILDTDKLPKECKAYIESLPNGYHIKHTDEEMEILGEEFDVSDYCEDMKLPKALIGENAKIDKVINMDY